LAATPAALAWMQRLQRLQYIILLQSNNAKKGQQKRRTKIAASALLNTHLGLAWRLAAAAAVVAVTIG